MTLEEQARLDELETQAIMNQGGMKFVTCKCSNVMEVEEGKVDYNQKDPTGKKLSKYVKNNE